MIDLTKIKVAHFIGIGGVSMRNLARFTSNFCKVTGSDMQSFGGRIKGSNIDVYTGSKLEYIDRADFIVYTAAIPNDDAELSYARAKGKITLSRAEYLGVISSKFDKTLAVAGTHGKTSVTAMLVSIFRSADKGVFGHIGGESIDLDDGYYFSGYEYMITEACEYKKSLLMLTPYVACVLNSEFDHPDTYGSLCEVQDTFRTFAEKSIKNCVVYDNCINISNGKQISYGFEDCEFRATNIVDDKCCFSFDVERKGLVLARVRLNVYGKYNVLNALASFVVAYLCGIEINHIISGLESFSGVKRRFECKGIMSGGARVIDDYAHHPSEISACIDTAKRICQNKIYTIFEPHTYSRTKNLLNEFLDCFCASDELIILPTYGARESVDDGMSANELYQRLTQRNSNVVYLDNYQKALLYVRQKAGAGDIVLTVGAGTITKLSDMLMTL